jgi:3-methyladenine DNA glycosylase AlkD
MSTARADELLARLDERLPTVARPESVPAMVAYLRGQFAFLGVAAPARVAVLREVTADLGRPDEADLRAFARGCWAREHRELQYCGCWYLRRWTARVAGPGFVDALDEAITQRAWWDTVDDLARTTGDLVAAHPELVAVMDHWAGLAAVGPDLWRVRVAILHQLAYKDATDTERLLRYCLDHAGDTDFFVRKAIGWALRQHARTDPALVRRFVQQHRAELHPLSVREALRHVGA